MAKEQILKMRIQLRRATTAEWEANKGVIPAAGEPCFDLDLGTLKIGDGKTPYERLNTIGGAVSGGVAVSADGDSIVLENNVFKLAGFDAAKTGAQPRKAADGKLEWVVPVDVTALADRVTALEEKMDGVISEDSIDEKIDAKINEFADKISDNGTVDTFKELVDYVASHGEEAANMAADIAELQGLVGDDSVSAQIASAVSGKVDKVPDKGLSTNDFTDGLLEKLDNIESKAQANKIEKISAGGSDVEIVDKAVNIPVASLDNAGVIKSATGANKVNVSNSGVMSVNKISAGSIFVPIGDTLVLDGGEASDDAPVYSTRIGNIGYDSIVDAVNDADNGDVITLQEDVNMGDGDNDNLVINAENVTIDLGEKTLTANGSNGAIKVTGGVTTLDGEGTVSGTLGSDNFSMAIWATSGTVVINGGTYTNMTDGSERGTDLIYASGNGRIEINGGVFEAAKPEWTLNVKNSDYAAGTASIVVKGGSFKNFNPADMSARNDDEVSFVAEGYQSVLEGEYYVVKPI